MTPRRHPLVTGALAALSALVFTGVAAAPSWADSASSTTTAPSTTVPSTTVPSTTVPTTTVPTTTVPTTTVPTTTVPTATVPTPTAPTATVPTQTVPAGTAPSAPLCTPAVVRDVQQLVESELAGRVTQLDTLMARVNGASSLTPTDSATLLAVLTRTELPGIEGLETTVRGDTTCLELRRDAHAMVFDYRVYVVMTPQTDLVVANDSAIHTESVLAGLEPIAAGAIERAKGRGTDVSGAQAAYAEFEANVAAAESLTTGQSATILGQTPADYPASRTVFLPARANLTDAVRHLRAGRDDLARIIQDLT
jgi:hypothetical protein